MFIVAVMGSISMQPSPYTSPQTTEINPLMIRKSMKRSGWAAFICGWGVVLPPLIALVAVVKSGVGAFAELSKSGTADPATLANEISVMILSMLWSLALSLVFLIAMILCLVKYRREKKCLRDQEASLASQLMS